VNDIRTVQAPAGWKLVIPAGWATLSTDPNVRNGQIKRLLDRQFAGTARDELIQVRVEADRQLHALVDPIVKLPISATLLVAQLYVGSDRDLVGSLSRLLGEAQGVLEVDNLTLGGVPATRRRRRALEKMGEEPEAPEAWHTHVDYMIQISMDDLLVLSFVTSTDALSDQLTFVFDSIAATLHQGDSGLEWQPTYYDPEESAT
jgi:hypothetical protein